jgi:hypothetical protein
VPSVNSMVKNLRLLTASSPTPDTAPRGAQAPLPAHLDEFCKMNSEVGPALSCSIHSTKRSNRNAKF